MQPADRDRSYIACIALCLAALILAAPAAGLNAEFSIYENGTGYSATVEIEDAKLYQFNHPGILGEPVPLKVRDIRLSNLSGDVAYETLKESEITFPQGDYILSYESNLDGNYLSTLFQTPYNVTVYLPAVYSIENPLLGYVSRGGSYVVKDNSTVITWEKTHYSEVRFYDELREIILYAFAMIWITVMVILLFGYYLMRAKKQK